MDLLTALRDQQFTSSDGKAALEEPGQEQFFCAQPPKTKAITQGWLHGCTARAVAPGPCLGGPHPWFNAVLLLSLNP